jgi:hypothetical protein
MGKKTNKTIERVLRFWVKNDKVRIRKRMMVRRRIWSI